MSVIPDYAAAVARVGDQHLFAVADVDFGGFPDAGGVGFGHGY